MSDKAQPSHPAQPLLNLIVTLLTPMFLAAAGNDLAFARQAAIETLNAYRAETQSDLITIAKIIGFGLAALAALSLSISDELPLRTMLRLHASANASDRSEHRNRQVLQQSQAHRASAPVEPDIDEAALTAAAADMKQRTADTLAQFTKPASTPEPEAVIDDEDLRYQATWAASAAAIAVETAASLPTLPPDERRSAAIWIDALNQVAQGFMTGDVQPRLHPGDLAAMTAPLGP